MPSPADLLEFPFLRSALAELALLAVAGGLLGAWIVLRRLAFFSHAVGTATFPGLVAAEAAGFSPKLAGLAVALGYAGGVERAGRAGRDPGNAATGLLLVAALAGGAVLAGDVFESGAGVDRLLFGTLVGLEPSDLWFSAVAAALALAGTLAAGRAWTATAFDPTGAPSLGVPAAAADALLLALIAFAAVASIPAVGALLVTALFVVPAATARLFAHSVPALLGGSVALALAEGAAGLYLAYWTDAPPGPALAILAAGVYAAAALIAAVRGRAR